MEREFLEGLGLPEGAVEAVLQAHGQEVESLRAEYDARNAQRDFEDALRAGLDGYRFSSGAARRAVEEAVRASGLQVENGKLEGLEAVMEDIRLVDPEAFAAGREPVRFTASMAHTRGSFSKNTPS